MNFKKFVENKDTTMQFEHLPKFLSAKEIIGSVSLEDHDDLRGRFDFANGDDMKLLDWKYNNAKKTGLLDKILKDGIKNPIEIHIDKDQHQTLTDGHHRLAIALEHFPKRLIPVKYWNG